MGSGERGGEVRSREGRAWRPHIVPLSSEDKHQITPGKSLPLGLAQRQVTCQESLASAGWVKVRPRVDRRVLGMGLRRCLVVTKHKTKFTEPDGPQDVGSVHLGCECPSGSWSWALRAQNDLSEGKA